MAGTLWSPDTCGTHPGCEIELDSDPASPTYGEPVLHRRVCSAHAAAAMDHAAVAVECRTKERARKAAADALALPVDQVAWTIDPQTRSLGVYAPPGLTAAGQASVQAAMSGTGATLLPAKVVAAPAPAGGVGSA